MRYHLDKSSVNTDRSFKPFAQVLKTILVSASECASDSCPVVEAVEPQGLAADGAIFPRIMTKRTPTLESNAAVASSAQYHAKNVLDFEDALCDGFYDPGRSRGKRGSSLPPLSHLQNAVVPSGREVILVDAQIDSALQELVESTRQHVTVLDASRATEFLLSVVSAQMGGPGCPSLLRRSCDAIQEAK